MLLARGMLSARFKGLFPRRVAVTPRLVRGIPSKEQHQSTWIFSQLSATAIIGSCRA